MSFLRRLWNWLIGGLVKDSSYRLRDGSRVSDPRLARLYELDWRSLNYPVTKIAKVAAAKKPRSYTWACDLWLEQGQEGSCVGHGCAHELAARPVPVKGLTHFYAREQIYWEAQKIDPWEGGSYMFASPFYEGTSVLAGVQVLQKAGFYTGYTWALNLEQLVLGVGYAGPAILGINWYENMFYPDLAGWIKPTGELAGGHCILAIGVHVVYKPGKGRTFQDLDLDKSYLLLHNSWGRSWGADGRAKINLADMDKLLNDEGDAAFPIRNPKKKVI